MAMSTSPYMTGVAPLAGSVGRNNRQDGAVKRISLSLPSRGAWVEMGCKTKTQFSPWVAPLAGSVGRNKTRYKETLEELKSLPSRGAWVEICRVT